MAMMILLTLLSALLGAVCWLAWETRRVSHALLVYAAAVKQWQEILRQVLPPRPDPGRPADVDLAAPGGEDA